MRKSLLTSSLVSRRHQKKNVIDDVARGRSSLFDRHERSIVFECMGFSDLLYRFQKNVMKV